VELRHPETGFVSLKGSGVDEHISTFAVGVFMSRVVAGMTMSLDGFVNDARGGVGVLYRDLADWRNTEQGKASIAAAGAVLMGRRTFEMASDPDSYAGQYEYQVPIFVLTRHRHIVALEGSDGQHEHQRE
jgi:dihydrofolate reductase